MRHRHRLDLQIAQLQLQLDDGYQGVARDATHLCQRLLGPRCRITVRWISVLVLAVFALRKL